MGKVMIHFSKVEFEYLAVLVAVERELYELNKDRKTAEVLGELHGKLLSCCVNGDCEAIING